MENASKALIIAGSIIVSLVIVSLGILIYRKTQTATDVSGVIQSQVEGYNEQYENLFGTYVGAANVKALLQKIKTNNTLYGSTSGSDASSMKIWVIFLAENFEGRDTTNGNDTMTPIINKIKQSKHYSVNVNNESTSDNEDQGDGKGYHRNGYIKTIVIDYAKNKNS